MKIVFCGGGTGGHVTPALAMADILRQKYKNANFAFVGREGGAENKAIERDGYRLYLLRIRGLKRTLSPRNIVAILLALRARREARRILCEESPDAVIGTGGYVSWPVLSAARRLGIPTAIHESNAYPGVVTRMMAPRCDLVMLGYSEARDALPRGCNAVVTGNPVRGRVGRIPRAYARSRLGISDEVFVVLSFGGSLGAARINEAMLSTAEEMRKERGILFIHATGRAEYDGLVGRGERLDNCRLLPYIEDMPLYLAAADAAVTRCGAMTLAEICAAGVPAILVPSPNVTADHQTKNAEALAHTGGAVLIPEGELSAERLKKEILNLRDRAPLRAKMRRRLRARGGERIAAGVLGAIERLTER